MENIPDGGIDLRYDRMIARRKLDRAEIFRAYEPRMIEVASLEELFDFQIWFWKCDKISRQSTINSLRKNREKLAPEILKFVEDFYRLRGIIF